ncbi:MAG: hydrogenase expression/formation protein [Neomegalonema sp.]|nr:hydrogenase expression/formation protein [Neomegalonema sp.]
MTNPFSAPLLGPGAQPADEDGAVLDYMQMPSGMITFAAPQLPEPEELRNCEAGLAVLEQTLVALNSFKAGDASTIINITDLDADNLTFVDQALGEGEVAAIGGDGAAQAQESILAGVWRVRRGGADGGVALEAIEIGVFPTLLSADAFDGAAATIAAPDTFDANIFNAPPLLTEINEHAPTGNELDKPHVINLSLLPHTEEDLALLDRLLGKGRLIILSRGYGNCRVEATGVRNVWWVRYYNSQDTLILNSLEITRIPEVALAASEDIADSAERLNEILEVYR